MKESTARHIEKLKAACDWLKIRRGRTREYIRCLEEFNKVEILSRVPDEHILAYYESFEVVELFQLWRKRVDDFPGLKTKIQDVCVKGPFLSKGETPRSTSNNRPRNDAFCFLVAGKCLASDITVVNVDGIASCRFKYETNADVTFKWEGELLDIQCKRVQSKRQLLKQAKKARDQIIGSGRCGVIAIASCAKTRPSRHRRKNCASRNQAQTLARERVTRQALTFDCRSTAEATPTITLWLNPSSASTRPR